MTALGVRTDDGDAVRDGGSRQPATSARRKLLEDRIRSGVRASEISTAGIPRRRDRGPAPLSVSQRQLWYLSQLAPDATAYNELATLRKDGPVNLHALRAAFDEFIRRHEAWRTTFELVDGEPCQVVHEPRAHPLPLLDLSGLSREDAEQQAAEVAVEDTRRPYDLATGPLVRPRLVRVAPDDHRLYLSMHHIVFDGVTLYRILLPEIVALYDAYSVGLPSPLPEPATQYSDYAAWEVEWAGSSEVESRVGYWREHLAGAPPLALPTDHPRPAIRRFAGGTVPAPIDAVTSELLSEVARRSGATLFQLLTALYAWWLGRYSTDDEVVFATVTDLRNRPELVDMAGYCLAPVVIRADVSGDPTVEEFVRRMRGELLDGLDHVVPFQWLVQQLGAARDPRRNPIFQVSFELEPPLLSPDPSWSLHQMDGATSDSVGQAKFDLTIELDERPDGHLDGRLLYDADLFTAGSARQMYRHWSRLLVAVATAAPETSLAELDSAEQPSHASPVVAPDGPDGRCIHDLLHDRAERQPDALAVVSEGRSLTYSELEASARVIAGRLVRAGAGPGTTVAAVLDRSVDLVAGLLGILMAGAAYLPLDPRHPASRLRFVVDDAGATLLLTQSSFSGSLPDLGLPAITLDQPVDESGMQAFPPRAPGSPRDLAYVIYTSGSTGQPKGVGVEHRSVTHLMGTLLQRVGLSSSDVIASVSAYTFDGSVGDIFCGLGLGACLVLASGEQTADPRALAELLHRSGATFMTATPTTWAGLVRVGWRAGSTFTAACGGETLPADLAAELLDRAAAVWNFFGPTEATVWATSGCLRPGEPVTVGTPLPGTDVHIVDSAGRRTPVGVPGEIVIGGPQVARGYVNRPEETARRFETSPIAGGGRRYRTGDRGRLLPGGEVQHLGRLDDQLKIRGYRIEPGEIESTLRQHPVILDAAIAVRSGETGEPVLAAYLVTRAGSDSDSDIRAWLRTRLPDHMTPTVIVRLAALPRSGSGKLDRAALPGVESPSRAPERSASLDRTTAGSPPALTPSTAGSVGEVVEAIWCDLLATDFVDRSTNFFDLGGHSLLAVTMLVCVEQQLGVRISLRDALLAGPTVEKLVDLIDGTPSSATEPTAADHVFFLFPDAASFMALRHFRRALEPATRVVGWPLRESEQDWTAADSVEGAAEQARDMIRELQPDGPYRIAGYSLAGLVAYEVARQLLEAGSAVDWVCLLDTPVPTVYHTRAARLGRGWSRGPWTFLERAAQLTAGRLAAIIGPSREHRATEPPPGAGPTLASRFRLTPHAVPLIVVASHESAEACRSPSLGWASVHPAPLALIPVPGDHGSMFRSPGREVMVEALARLHPHGGNEQWTSVGDDPEFGSPGGPLFGRSDQASTGTRSP